MTDNTEQGAPGAGPSVTPDLAARKAEIRAQLQTLGAALPHHNAGLDKHEAALQAAQDAARASGGAPERPNESAAPEGDAGTEAEQARSAGEQPPAELEPEPEAEDEDEAEVASDAAPAVEEPMPAEISDQIGHETRASAVARVDTFLAEARYFLRNLHYEFDGETGEILAFLRQKLRP